MLCGICWKKYPCDAVKYNTCDNIIGDMGEE